MLYKEKMTSSNCSHIISEIVRERRYDSEIEKYVQKPPKNKDYAILDEEIRKKTFLAMINKMAIFVGVDCSNCGMELVDPSGGILANKKMRHARCGRCGYTSFVSKYRYRAV